MAGVYLRALLALSLAVGLLAACTPPADGGETGATRSSSTGGEGPKVAIVYDTGGLGDKSFNDSADRGGQRAASELGAEVINMESVSPSDYATNLEEAAEAGNDLVVAIGINMQADLAAVAPRYPDTQFAIVDAVVDEPNVRSLLFREEEGSYLVGYLAGKMSEGGKIGFVGGQKIPLIEKFAAGYIAGARMANPDMELLPPKYTGDWENTDAAKVAASQLFSQGADIVFHAAGKAGLGVIKAAEEADKWAIGVDSNQDDIAPGNVLTSMIKNVDEAVFSTIRDVKEGSFSGGTTTYDLAVGGVGISPLEHTRDQIGEDNLADLDDVKQKIIEGEIEVPTALD